MSRVHSSSLATILSLAVLILAQTKAMDFINRGVPDHETTLTDEDFEMARWVSDGHLSKKHNPLLKAGKFEGDIDGIDLHDGNARSAIQKNAVRSEQLLWPSGRVPYAISSQFSSMSRARIAAAIKQYSELTCIQFVPHDNEHDYVYLFPGKGCYSRVGKSGGQQRISLGRGCVQKGIIMHELMHSVGFFHEQSRTDRDDNVEIKWENILSGMNGQFQKYSQTEIQFLGTSYDYGSIMHYGPRDFSKNGLPTIVPKQADAEIGQRRGFSQVDIEKLNRLYKCSDPGVKTGESSSSEGSESCEDRLGNCKTLAEGGGCEAAAEWMNEWCKLSCNRCQKPVKPSVKGCKDGNKNCNFWAKGGLCDSFEYGRYMSLFCRASYNKC